MESASKYGVGRLDSLFTPPPPKNLLPRHCAKCVFALELAAARIVVRNLDIRLIVVFIDERPNRSSAGCSHALEFLGIFVFDIPEEEWLV